MLILRIFSILAVSFYLALPMLAMAGNGRPTGRYLRPPAVTWQDGRVSGEVRNAPIQGLVEDLLRSGGYEWYVDGKLPGQISITFDGLTPTESVHKIMKQSDFNFAMIQADGEKPGAEEGVGIAQLTVYQEKGYVRFKRTAQKTTPAYSSNTRLKPTVPKALTKAAKQSPQMREPSAKPVKAPTKASRTNPIQKSDLIPEERVKMDKELKVMLDEMLAKKEITEEQYREAVEELGRTGK